MLRIEFREISSGDFVAVLLMELTIQAQFELDFVIKIDLKFTRNSTANLIAVKN